MLTAVALFVLGFYLAYDLIYLPQRGPMASSEAGFALVFLALPMIFFGALGLTGLGLILVKRNGSPAD